MHIAPQLLTFSGKCTVFFRSELRGVYQSVEARLVHAQLRKCAQFPSALEVSYMLPRQSKFRSKLEMRPSVVIVEGWGHPDPDTWEKTLESQGVVRAHDAAVDPALALLLSELEDAGQLRVIADYRGHNSRRELQVAS